MAAFMRCRGFTIRCIRGGEGRSIFVFDDTADVRDAVLEFANDGPVAVRSFCNTLRDLKAIVRDARTSCARGAVFTRAGKS